MNFKTSENTDRCRSVPTSSCHQPRQRAAAFSLMELLVVILIIGIVTSILLPTIGHVRRFARSGATRDTLHTLKSSIAQFELDQRRLPGVFSARDLGSSENKLRGFTPMDNMVLDLAGGLTDQPSNFVGDPCNPSGTTDIVEVGPTTTAKVRVDLSNVGASTSVAGVKKGAYLKIDPKLFVRQCAQGTKRSTNVTPDHLTLPALVDTFGSPILAWVQDEIPGTNPAFALDDSSTRARFYHVSNHAFLNATELGKLGADQKNTTGGSLLCETANSDNAAIASLVGLFGNPASPDPADPTKPTAARGRIIFHSAGPNGIYVGKQERGGKTARDDGSGGRVLDYNPSKDPLNDGSFDDIFDFLP